MIKFMWWFSYLLGHSLNIAIYFLRTQWFGTDQQSNSLICDSMVFNIFMYLGSIIFITNKKENNQWRIQDFPDGGANPWVWGNNLFCKIFAKKLDRGMRVPSARLNLPMRMYRRSIGGSKGSTLARPLPPCPKNSRFRAVFWKIWQNWMLAPPARYFVMREDTHKPHHPYLWGKCADDVVWTRQEVDIQDDVTWSSGRITDARRGWSWVVVEKFIMWVSERKVLILSFLVLLWD